MVYLFKAQIHDQYIVNILTEDKYLGGRYEILDPDTKKYAHQIDKKQYLECAFIFQNEGKRYDRIVE